MTTDPAVPFARRPAIRPNAAHRFVPVDGPTRRPSTFSTSRIVPTDAASGTLIIRSIACPTNDGSTLGRPMPSIFDPRPVRPGSESRQAGKNAEPSGSGTHNLVGYPRYRTYRPIVALVPPVPAPTTIHSGIGCRSSRSWEKIDSAMLLFPRQSVARSAWVNWSM